MPPFDLFSEFNFLFLFCQLIISFFLFFCNWIIFMFFCSEFNFIFCCDFIFIIFCQVIIYASIFYGVFFPCVGGLLALLIYHFSKGFNVRGYKELQFFLWLVVTRKESWSFLEETTKIVHVYGSSITYLICTRLKDTQSYFPKSNLQNKGSKTSKKMIQFSR